MIFICGPHNSGKTTLAKWLGKQGLIHIETGDIVRKTHQKLDPNQDFYDWAKKVNANDPDFLNRVVLEEIDQRFASLTKNKKVVITGNRQMDGIRFIINNTKYKNKYFCIIFLDADEEELFRRQKKRNDERIAKLNRKSFRKYLEYDIKMGINEIKKHADTVIDTKRISINAIRKQTIKFLTKHGYTK